MEVFQFLCVGLEPEMDVAHAPLHGASTLQDLLFKVFTCKLMPVLSYTAWWQVCMNKLTSCNCNFVIAIRNLYSTASGNLIYTRCWMSLKHQQLHRVHSVQYIQTNSFDNRPNIWYYQLGRPPCCTTFYDKWALSWWPYCKWFWATESILMSKNYTNALLIQSQKKLCRYRINSTKF